MRVTANYYSDTLIQQLDALQSRQARLQQQAATGQRIVQPGDDPSGMRQVLNLQTQGAGLVQYANNITRQQELATATYSVMGGLKTVSDRASEIATMADGTKSKDDLGIYAKEVSQLIQQAVATANSKDRDSYLLSGTKSTTPPYTIATDANGNVTSVTYNGNSDLPASEVAPGSTIVSGAVGSNTSGSGPQGLVTDSRTGADFFNHLIQLQNDLLAGNTSSIQTTDKTSLSNDENNLLQNISNNGAVQARLGALSALNQNQQTGVQQSVSNVADADITQTILNLNTTQTVYQAALQSSAKVMGMSLMNYMQ